MADNGPTLTLSASYRELRDWLHEWKGGREAIPTNRQLAVDVSELAGELLGAIAEGRLGPAVDEFDKALGQFNETVNTLIDLIPHVLMLPAEPC